MECRAVSFDQYQANFRQQQELVDDCSYSKNPYLQVRMEAILKYGGHFEFGAFIIAPMEPLAPKPIFGAKNHTSRTIGS